MFYKINVFIITKRVRNKHRLASTYKDKQINTNSLIKHCMIDSCLSQFKNKLSKICHNSLEKDVSMVQNSKKTLAF